MGMCVCVSGQFHLRQEKKIVLTRNGKNIWLYIWVGFHVLLFRAISLSSIALDSWHGIDFINYLTWAHHIFMLFPSRSRFYQLFIICNFSFVLCIPKLINKKYAKLHLLIYFAVPLSLQMLDFCVLLPTTKKVLCGNR